MQRTKRAPRNDAEDDSSRGGEWTFSSWQGLAQRLEQRLEQRLAQPVAADSVAVFRSCYGFLMAWTMGYFVFDGRAERILFGTLVKFRFSGFEWVPVFSKTGTLVVCWVLLAAALAIGFGVWYRQAAAVFAVGYGFIFLYDVSNYNNHDYLVIMLAVVLAIVPHSSVATLTKSSSPRTVPTWALWLLCFHIALPYFFGGVAKLGYDWIVLNQPMILWFRTGGVEGLERVVKNPELWGMLLSLAGVVFDLAIVPLLLIRRTRLLAYGACLVFHLSNSQLFTIGPFPWLMIAATLLFLAPTWPQRLRLTKSLKSAPVSSSPASNERSLLPGWALLLLASWVLVQCSLPFRHLLYEGPVNWNEKGERFAWRMKLRDKSSTMKFEVAQSGGPWKRIDALDAALTRRQLRMMEHKPEMVRQFAVFLKEKLDPADSKSTKIRVDYKVSLNARGAQRLIDSEVDLLTLAPGGPASAWLLPMEARR